MKPKDFSNRTRFPRTDSSQLDFALCLVDAIETLPANIFAAMLFALALVSTLGKIFSSFGLWIFFLSDWGLIAALPRAGKSFGPAKPPTLLLASLHLDLILQEISDAGRRCDR
jgi:hypothetical protein